MQFIPDETYLKIDLQNGLEYLESGYASRLYSDGLLSDQFICFEEGKGFLCEDGSVIGKNFNLALHALWSIPWCRSHNFFIKKSEYYGKGKQS